MKVDGLREFSIKNRKKEIESISNPFDLIVIGGGITGAGILLDASLRGLKVLLVEKTDFASGTSSKSTKLIHGGLRYLKQLEIGLVRETGMERAVAHKNACHLVHPENMLLPIVQNGTFSKFSASLAIAVYDLLAGVEKSQRRKNLTKDDVSKLEPLLKSEALKSGIVYSEYRTDDARLTIELVKAALRNGGMAFNHMEVKDFIYTEDHQVGGVICYDHIQGEETTFNAQQIVSSSGPWVDSVNKIEDEDSESNLHLTKGSHIVFSRTDFNLKQSIYFDAFDDRMIFAIPRGKVVYVGTTDTSYDKSLDDIRCTNEDATYLLDALKRLFHVEHLSIKDIKSSWAGVRPLIKQKGKGPSEISRKDEIFISESGLISIAGGKLTGFRKMAQKIVDLVARNHKGEIKYVDTEDFKIHHRPFNSYPDYLHYITILENKYKKLIACDFQYIVSTFGKDAEVIIQHAVDNKIDIDQSQLEYTMKYEAVYHPLDHIERRTGWLYFAIERAKKNQALVPEELGKYLDKEQSWVDQMIKKVESQIQINSLS